MISMQISCFCQPIGTFSRLACLRFDVADFRSPVRLKMDSSGLDLFLCELMRLRGLSRILVTFNIAIFP